MPDKPNPKDFPFNYAVCFIGDEGSHELIDCASYREAKRLIQERSRLAVLATEWNDGLYGKEKIVYASKADRNRAEDFQNDEEFDPYRDAFAIIVKRRDAYESALQDYQLDQYDPEEDEWDSPTGDTRELGVCSVCDEEGRDLFECEQCGDLLCSSACDSKHVCTRL